MYVYCLYVSEYPAWAYGRVLSSRAPVVVLSGGRVIARRRIQQLRGIAPGDRTNRVQRLCPEAVLRIRDIQLEQACWDDVLREINTITPFIEVHDPPFVYFAGADFADVRSLSARLSVQVGAGEYRSLAQLAALRSAEGHVLQLRPRRWKAFLRRFEVDRLAELDFPEDMLEQLQLFGYSTLDGVRKLNERQIQAQFGNDGNRLYRMLHPKKEARIPLYRPPSSVEIWHEFDDTVAAEPGVLEPILMNLVDRASRRLGVYRCHRIRVGIQHARAAEPRWEGRILSAPRSVPGTLYSLAAPLLGQLLGLGMEVEGIGIRLESLRPPSAEQAALFNERPAVLGAVRSVHRRYPGLIRRAVLQADALFEEDEVTLETIATGGSE